MTKVIVLLFSFSITTHGFSQAYTCEEDYGLRNKEYKLPFLIKLENCPMDIKVRALTRGNFRKLEDGDLSTEQEFITPSFRGEGVYKLMLPLGWDYNIWIENSTGQRINECSVIPINISDYSLKKGWVVCISCLELR